MLSYNSEYGVANLVWPVWPDLIVNLYWLCVWFYPWLALAQTEPEHGTFSKTILTAMVSTHMNLNALVTG